MEGYYMGKDQTGESTGRLNISVTNIPEFNELIEKAKKEADQLIDTIARLRRFDIEIDFNVEKKTTLGK